MGCGCAAKRTQHSDLSGSANAHTGISPKCVADSRAATFSCVCTAKPESISRAYLSYTPRRRSHPMLTSKKMWSSVVCLTLVATCAWLVASPVQGDSKLNGVTCVIDMLIETHSTTGSVSLLPYHQEFTLQDGGRFFDDFSTRTRFNFFDASLNKVNGEWVMSLDWTADTTVFNSVDYNTAIVLATVKKLASRWAAIRSSLRINGPLRTSRSFAPRTNPWPAAINWRAACVSTRVLVAHANGSPICSTM